MCEVLSQPLEAECSPLFSRATGIMPEGPCEGTSALCECETFGCGVKVRPTSGCGAAGIGCDEPTALRVRSCDDPQQLTLGGSRPTPDARPDRTVRALRDVELWNHRPTLYRGRGPYPNSAVVRCPRAPDLLT